jgi:hypothetical protein
MSGLVQFLVNVVALLAAGGIFFLAIDRVSPDDFFARIAKIAVGALLIIALIFTVAAVFGISGGVAVSPLGVVWFAVAVIVAIVVLYVINLVLDFVATQMGGAGWVAPVKYILGAIVLIGLLIAAANLMFGYKVGNLSMRSEEKPFLGHRAYAASAVDLSRMLNGQL